MNVARKSVAFADGHMHSNPVKGMGMAAIGKKFVGVGGWFVAVVSLPPHHFGFDDNFDGYVRAFDVLVRECNTGKELGLEVVCFAGIHPAAIENSISMNPKDSVKVLGKAFTVLDYVAKLVRNGFVDGFGEVGRPHYKTIPEAFVVNNIVMTYALVLAKDLGVPVHLHLEQGGEITVMDIDRTISTIGIDKDKVVLHHLDVATAKASQAHTLVFTIPGKHPILKEVFRSLRPTYMIESDFIDDPKRPGVSSYPWDIVENQKRLLNEGLVDEEYIYKLNIDVVVKTYKVKPP